MNSISEQNYIQQVSIDCVIFGYQNRQLQVLVPKLAFEGDFWGLPGGFIHQDEDIDAAARRILYDRTGITDVFLEQFQVMGKANRSSQTFLNRLVELNANNPLLLFDSELRRKDYEWYTRRFITIGYYALVDVRKIIPQKTNLDESIDWYPVEQVPTMIMDYNELVQKALQTLRLTLDQKLSAFNLLPETFTMQEVQDLYEAIFNKRFAQNNFPKKILRLNVLERLEKKYTGAANKAPYLYRVNKGQSNQLLADEFAVD